MNMKTKSKSIKVSKDAEAKRAVKLNGKVQALEAPRTKAEAEAQIDAFVKENRKVLRALSKL
jgi:hypothetical protein